MLVPHLLNISFFKKANFLQGFLLFLLFFYVEADLRRFKLQLMLSKTKIVFLFGSQTIAYPMNPDPVWKLFLVFSNWIANGNFCRFLISLKFWLTLISVIQQDVFKEYFLFMIFMLFSHGGVGRNIADALARLGTRPRETNIFYFNSM